VALIESDDEVAVACDGRLQNQIVIWIGGNGPPEKIQSMQPRLRTYGVDHIVDFRFREAELCAITLEYSFVLQHHCNRDIGPPTVVSQKTQQPERGPKLGSQCCNKNIRIDNYLIHFNYFSFVFPPGSFSINGTQKRKVAPFPGVLAASIPPPWAERMAREIARPIPDPLRDLLPRLPR
jgi:hypothetical protein